MSLASNVSTFYETTVTAQVVNNMKDTGGTCISNALYVSENMYLVHCHLVNIHEDTNEINSYLTVTYR